MRLVTFVIVTLMTITANADEWYMLDPASHTCVNSRTLMQKYGSAELGDPLTAMRLLRSGDMLRKRELAREPEGRPIGVQLHTTQGVLTYYATMNDCQTYH